MATTIPGGAYIRVDGRTVVNANGQPLPNLTVQKGHKIVETKQAKGAANQNSEALPKEFPGLKDLKAAGYETYASLQGVSRQALIDLDGIGEVTADRILEALAQLPLL